MKGDLNQIQYGEHKEGFQEEGPTNRMLKEEHLRQRGCMCESWAMKRNVVNLGSQ
jgi:hypothetical protein